MLRSFDRHSTVAMEAGVPPSLFFTCSRLVSVSQLDALHTNDELVMVISADGVTEDRRTNVGAFRG
jgi:hypothetical protein